MWGAPVAGNFIIGPFDATSTTLSAGVTYQAMGLLFVPAGKSLTIPAGTRINFYTTTHGLTADGALTVQGAWPARLRY